MRSIRLSLIVYFLVLVTVALAAVSWLSYQMAERSLRDRQRDSEARIRAQFEVTKLQLYDDVDRRLYRQAHVLVNVSQSAFIHAEGQFALLGMIGAGGAPNGHLNYALFWCEIAHKDLSREIFFSQPLSTRIENADKLVGEEDEQHAQEYFQTYRSNGVTMERSESLVLEDQSFELDEKFRKNAELSDVQYDTVTLKDDVKVRRITLKTTVPSYEVTMVQWPFKNVPPPNIFAPKGGAAPKTNKGGAKGSVKGPVKAPAPPRPPVKMPVIYVQYASNIAPTDALVSDHALKRDAQLIRLGEAIDSELNELRSSFFLIGLSTLAAVWLGGFLMIRIGLAPLSKMSEAVRQVSVKDFHLPIETAKLPRELQPIAGRLVELLNHLEKAFAREKQAAADISHELRTPLAALMTTLEVAMKKRRSVDEYHEILDECRSSGQHMYHLVERLLMLARLDAGADQYRPTETDVTEVALACADLIRPLARARNLELRVHLPEPITTQTDANKLRELLINLLHNAVEYNKDNGAIDLSVERAGGKVRFEVRDTGIGIKPAALEHIFERFYRADPSRHADTPHAGLGLAIVKSYVDLMGGTIRVESSDAGTAFVVELPLAVSIHDRQTAVKAAPALAGR